MGSLLAVTILGVTFSGTYALIAAAIIVVLIGAGWFVMRRRR
jgi:LPXTG-motif cell wall-anchored protein